MRIFWTTEHECLKKIKYVLAIPIMGFAFLLFSTTPSAHATPTYFQDNDKQLLMSLVDTEVDYFVTKAQSDGKRKLEVHCALFKTYDEAVLVLLGDRIYSDYNGSDYDLVTINWHVIETTAMKKPWAYSNLTRNGSLRLMP